MTLKEIQEKLQKEFEVTGVDVFTNYIIKIGKQATITTYFKNNELQKIVVDGKGRDRVLECLGLELKK